MVDFVKIGRLLKTFGTEGDLRCQIGDEYEHLLEVNRFVFVEIDGLKVPFQIRKVAHHHKPLIAFTDVDTELQAKPLRNQWLYVNPDDFPDKMMEVSPGTPLRYSFLIGYKVSILGSPMKGIVKRVAEFPAQEMAFVAFQKDQLDEMMIPLAGDLITTIDKANKEILFDLPQGMFTL